MTQPANFYFAEEEPAPVDSLHGVISTPLPCPFCGGAVTPEELKHIGGWLIRCHACLKSDRGVVSAFAGSSEEEAIARWNRRAPPPVTEDWKQWHVPVTGTQHDPANGLLHGYCARCRVPWPCEYSPEYKKEA